MNGKIAKRLRARAQYLSQGAPQVRYQTNVLSSQAILTNCTKEVEKSLKEEHRTLTDPEKQGEQVGVKYAHKLGLDFRKVRRAMIIKQAIRQNVNAIKKGALDVPEQVIEGFRTAVAGTTAPDGEPGGQKRTS